MTIRYQRSWPAIVTTESCNNANFVFTVDTLVCHDNNLLCHQWRQYWHQNSSGSFLANHTHVINTLMPRQNGCHFADDIFKYIFLNGNVWISIKISLKFVSKDPVNNIPALAQIMAWCRPGSKPLSEPVIASFLTHICVAQPQWVGV